MWWVPLASAAASVVSSAMQSEDAEDARHAAEQNAQRNIALQKEFAQHGIRWKVEDAKAAGLHPLFALGSVPTSFSPVTIDPPYQGGGGGSLDWGKIVNQVAQGISAYRAANANEVPPQIFDANSADWDPNYDLGIGSQPAFDSLSFSGDLQLPHPGYDYSDASPSGTVRFKPDTAVSSRYGAESVTAAPQEPGMKEYRVTQRMTMLLPRTDEGPGEALENIAWWMWPSIIKMNVAHFGERWLNLAVQEFVPGGQYLNMAAERTGMGRLWLQGKLTDALEAMGRLRNRIKVPFGR